MANNVTKKQVWRETVPTFTRVIFGIIIFFGYLGTACGFISFLVLLTQRQHIIEGLKAAFENDFALNSVEFIYIYLVEVYYAIGSAKTVFTLLMILCLVSLLISLGSTIWLHFWKSRVVISIFFMQAVCSFLYSIVILIDGREALGLGMRLVVFLINTFVLIIYMNCVKATYRYHYFLKKEIQFQENKIRQSIERNDRKEPYPITKPRLQESIYPVKELKPKDDVIKIDDFIDKVAKESNDSIYRGTSENKGEFSNSSIQNTVDTKTDDKQHQSKARIRIEKDEDILGNNATDPRYEMEKRPLLSSIKENIEAENTKDVAEIVELKEEVKPIETENSEATMESEQSNTVVDVTEPEVGMTVDTSLGYRRITFDDL